MFWYKSFFWKEGCLDPKRWPKAREFLEKVAEIINKQDLGVVAEIQECEKGVFINLRNKRNRRRIHVLGSQEVPFFSYDCGNSTIDDDFVDGLSELLYSKIRPAYDHYRRYCQEIDTAKYLLDSMIREL